ncbi:MAG: 50S ribosomal protein L11 methyltransferase [Spirochaetia bacterium]|nr:50S ribosomal protein L11 methyltransferase [Spirochaetia bacterium]
MKSNKSFWEVEIVVPKERSTVFEEFIIKSGALGYHELLYKEGVTENLSNDETVHNYYFDIAFPVRAFLPMAAGLFSLKSNSYEIRQVFYDDFLKYMAETFSPFKITERFWVVSPLKKDEFLPEKSDKIIINPAFAFGTGRHATTQLVMQIMELIDFKGMNVLDMGTGSGILTITALAMGASRAVGVDVEKLSVESANENYLYNVNDNNLKGKGEFFEGDFSWLNFNEQYSFQIFLSNILPEIFYQNKKNVASYLQKTGIWILSGIVSEKQEEFLSWLAEVTDHRAISIREKDGWLAFYNF